MLKTETGINSYLTGLSGGVRYTPVVRYNKIHVYISPEDIKEAIDYLDIKEVNSGANIAIFPLENDSYIKDSRQIGESTVVSPLQIYLDCMQLKGRGEEMAENKNSRARIEANNRYNAKAYDRINVAVPKGRKDIIKAHAEKNGESVNGFVNRAINETIQRDGE